MFKKRKLQHFVGPQGRSKLLTPDKQTTNIILYNRQRTEADAHSANMTWIVPASTTLKLQLVMYLWVVRLTRSCVSCDSYSWCGQFTPAGAVYSPWVLLEKRCREGVGGCQGVAMGLLRWFVKWLFIEFIEDSSLSEIMREVSMFFFVRVLCHRSQKRTRRS